MVSMRSQFNLLSVLYGNNNLFNKSANCFSAGFKYAK
jgi:hypothetical protein